MTILTIHSLVREAYSALQSLVAAFSFAPLSVAIISSLDAMALFSAFSATALIMGKGIDDSTLLGAVEA